MKAVRGALLMALAVAGLSAVCLLLLFRGPTPSIESCHKLGRFDSYADRCYENGARKVLEREGPRVGMARLDKLATTDLALNTRCHRMMHEYGRERGRSAYRKDPNGDPFTGAPTEPRACGSGYIHGIVEGYTEAGNLLVHPNDKLVDVMCQATKGGVPFAFAVCAHGVGHALFRNSKGDVTGSALGCQSMTGATRQECTSGVMMSAFEGMQFDGGPGVQAGGRSVERTQAYCNTFTGHVRVVCFRYLPLSTEFPEGLPFRSLNAACTTRVDAAARSACLIGLGRLQARDGDADTIAQKCATVADALDRIPCVYGAAVNRAFNSTVPMARNAKECAAMHTAESTACYMALGRTQFFVARSDADKASVCAPLSGERASWCRRGADLQLASADGMPEELVLVGELRAAFAAAGHA